MKTWSLIMSVVLMAPLCITVPAWADGDSPEDTPDWQGMVKQRQNTTEALMSMLKETMAILKDMNRKPSDQQQQRLSAMMARLDGMLERHKKMMELHDRILKHRQELLDRDADHDRQKLM
ncbi:MAG: hypothetical protein P8164_09885 [Gammaproteobacteria bacterium]|jgi:hypothetical protein